LFHATFGVPVLTIFCNLDSLGLVVVGQRVDVRRAVLECRVADADDGCRSCGGRGRPLGTASRTLAHEPFGGRPTTLLVRVRGYRCTVCARFWSRDTSAAAEPRAKVSRGGLAWALRALGVDHLSVTRIAAGLGVAWNTANDAVLTEGHRQLINDPARFDGVAVIGVDEHVWRHTPFGDKYVTVIIDLTPVRESPAVLCRSHVCASSGGDVCVVGGLVLLGRDVADAGVQAVLVVPVDPRDGHPLDVFETT